MRRDEDDRDVGVEQWKQVEAELGAQLHVEKHQLRFRGPNDLRSGGDSLRLTDDDYGGMGLEERTELASGEALVVDDDRLHMGVRSTRMPVDRREVDDRSDPTAPLIPNCARPRGSPSVQREARQYSVRLSRSCQACADS